MLQPTFNGRDASVALDRFCLLPFPGRAEIRRRGSPVLVPTDLSDRLEEDPGGGAGIGRIRRKASPPAPSSPLATSPCAAPPGSSTSRAHPPRFALRRK